MTRPNQLRNLAIRSIGNATGGEVTLESARYSISEGLTLTGLRVALPGVKHGELFTAEEVWIDPDYSAMMFGSPAANRILLDQPTLYITEDRATGRYLFQQLFEGEGDSKTITNVPEIVVDDARLVFREINPQDLRELDQLTLEGTLTASQTPGDYRFELHQVTTGTTEAQAPTLHGRFNLNEPSFSIALDRFRFKQPQRYFLRHELRDWWSKLTPSGEFTQLDVSYDTSKGWQANLILENAEITLPIDTYTPRMTNITGRVRVRGHRLILERLSGFVEGLRYQVVGEIFDLREREQSAFVVRGATNWFNLAPDPKKIEQLPTVAQKHYDRFKPQGDFRVTVDCTRDVTGGKIDFDGRVRLKNAAASYYKFPYPAHNVEGLIRFNPEAVTIERLTGLGPSGATFAFESGHVSPPGEGASVKIKLRAKNVPLDDHMLAAMKPKHRKVLDLFFDQVNYQRLIDEGLLHRSGETGGGLAFEPGGAVKELIVEIDRPRGDDVKSTVHTTIDIEGLRAVYHHWPYPLEGKSGQVVVRPDDVEVDVEMTSPTGASGRVVGVLHKNEEGRLTPDLKIKDATIPIGDLLAASIPPPQDHWIRELHMSGELHGNGWVAPQKESGEVGFQLDGKIVNGQATPFGGKFNLNALGGEVTIERERLTIHQVTGSRDNTTLTLGGEIDFTSKPAAIDLHVASKNLSLDQTVADLLPPTHPAHTKLSDLFKQYNAAGKLDVDLHYHTREGEAYDLKIEPDTLLFDLAGHRVSLDEMSGQALATPNNLQLKSLSARFDGDATLIFDGHALMDGSQAVSLEVIGQGNTIGPSLRAILPLAAQTTLQTLKADTGFVLHHAKLISDDSGFDYKSSMLLREAQLQVGVEVTQLDGRLNLTASKTKDQIHPQLSFDLHADRLRAAERLIQQLNIHANSTKQGQTLTIEEFVGSIYGGALIGNGLVQFEAPVRYQFDLALQDVELAPFLRPKEIRNDREFEPHAVDEPSYVDSPQRQTASGLLNAGMTIEARVNDPTSKQGRGTIEVRGAQLYDQPLAMVMLQTINLTLPTERSFDRSSARFLIDGDTVLFDSLRFDAPSLSISGAGTMDYPTQTLSLDMVTRSPMVGELGAVGEVFNAFKDEILAIRVTGTLEKPKSNPISFQGIRKSWDQLFRGKAATGPRQQE